MRRANRHIHNPDLVFDLTHHDAQLATVPGHPMQYSGRRTHRIGAVKSHSRRGPSHRQRLVTLEEREFLAGVGEREGKRLEMSSGIVVAGPSDTHVLGDHRLAFSLELNRQDLFEQFELDSNQSQQSPKGDGILNQITLDVGSELFDRKGTELNAVGGCSRLDLVAVIEDSGSGSHELEMPIHAILVQRNQHVQLVAQAENWLVAGSER